MILLEFAWDNIFSLASGRVDLADRGLCLITGENQDEGGGNGAGKSSFANKGIIWTLYGQTPGGIRADAVINRHSDKKSGWGSVTFMRKGEEYTVKRYRPAKLRFWKGPDEITAKKAVETQEMIDQTLGRDFKTFIQSEMFGQGRASDYATLTGAEQKRVLEQILPIETLDEWAEEAKTKAVEVKTLLDKANTKVEVEQGKLHSITQQLENMIKKSDQWEEDTNRKIIAKRNELEKYSEQIAKSKDRIEQLEINIKQVIRPTPDKIKKITRQIEEAREAEIEAEKLFDQTNKVKEKWWERVLVLKGKVFNKLDTLDCPTCGRPWDKEYVDEHNSQCQNNFMDFKEAEVSYKIALNVAKQYQDHFRQKTNELFELQNRYTEMTEEERKFSNFMMEKNRHEQFLAGEPTKIREQMNIYISEVNPHTESIDELRSKVNLQVKEIEKVEKKVKTLDSEHKDLIYWHRAYSKDIKIKLFAAACPFLDHAVATHLKDLNNSQLHVQFSTIKILSSGEGKEDFNVRCWNDTGGEGFDTLSGGEQQMVSFAIGRALADLARTQTTGEYQFQILDEPFTELDEPNFEAVVNYIQKDIKGTVLLISNDSSLKGLIQNRIHVIKKNGISEVIV